MILFDFVDWLKNLVENVKRRVVGKCEGNVELAWKRKLPLLVGHPATESHALRKTNLYPRQQKMPSLLDVGYTVVKKVYGMGWGWINH